MSVSEKKNRIIFIDLMRAFAVMMMVQGHTVDVLLSNNYRNLDSPVFLLWFFMRGMTAPIFLFTAGTVFTYLFRLVKEPFETNPRVIKGFKRFLLLVSLGYILRYPTASIIIFSDVTQSQWETFFAVDVLQLIGFGILFLVISMYIAERLRISDYFVFITGAFLFFILFTVFEKIPWSQFLPLPFAGYMYRGSGSNFPLFPWAGYVLAGGILGSFLARNPLIFRTLKFSLQIGLAGIAFVAVALIGDYFETKIYGQSYLWTTSVNLVLLRLGIVLVITSFVSWISLKVDSIPRVVILIGRNTLLIYIVHLVILYGSAWNPGIILLFDKSFGVWKTVGSALTMLSLMTIMVLLINKLKIKNKQLVT